MVPLMIKTIYTLYSGYVLGISSLLKGSLGWVNQLGYHPKGTTILPMKLGWWESCYKLLDWVESPLTKKMCVVCVYSIGPLIFCGFVCLLLCWFVFCGVVGFSLRVFWSVCLLDACTSKIWISSIPVYIDVCIQHVKYYSINSCTWQHVAK